MLDSLLESRIQILDIRTLGLWVCVLVASLPIAGCFTAQAKRPSPHLFTPPPVQSHVIVPAEPPLLEADESLNLAPPENPWDIANLTMPVLPGPPKPSSPPPRAPAPAKATATPAPVPPKFAQLFTAEQTREYNKAYDESLERVKRALASLEKRSLTPAQRRAMERIRTFQEQAEREHERDLVTAVNLVKRADALSADLVTRVQ
jgi:hypothetical protein